MNKYNMELWLKSLTREGLQDVIIGLYFGLEIGHEMVRKQIVNWNNIRAMPRIEDCKWVEKGDKKC